MTKKADLVVKQSSMSRRKKIWSFNEGHICSVVGTCLRRSELRNLAGKKQFGLGRGSSDFQLHAALVNQVCSRTIMSRTLNKILDKKYRIFINRYAKARDDQSIKMQWDEDVEKGNIPGAYWAIITHPVVSSELLGDIYGQIHMMGHDSHGDYQRDNKILEGLREKVVVLEEVLGSECRHYLEKKQVLEEALAGRRVIEQQYSVLKRENDELRKANEMLESGLAESLPAIEVKSLKQQVDELRRYNASLCGRIDGLTTDWEDKENLLEIASHTASSLEEINSGLQAEKEELQQEIMSLEAVMLYKMDTSCGCSVCEDQNTERCSGPELCGKTVLYVGGQHKMIPHYKKLVEKYGGRFLHHDGGKEVARARLPKMLIGADVVLCPVDCVSHDACNCVKKICKRYHKPFVMMRSSGLSSLTKGLGEVIQ